MTVIRQYAKSWSPSSHQSIPKNISLGLALARASAIQELEEEFFRNRILVRIFFANLCYHILSCFFNERFVSLLK